jgi:HPt (histidine-containing phosphotransfer) domain-containing protein
MAEHIDLNTIQQLKELMADDFQLLIETFVIDSEKRLVMLSDSIETDDAEKLRTSAHAFKGSALNLSAANLTELCYKLEMIGKQGSVNGADSLLQQVEEEYQQVKASLLAL